MAKVKFLVDFRGKLTREIYYLAGSVAEFESDIAGRLVSEGWAVMVEPEEPEPTESPAESEPAKEAKPKLGRKRKV